MTSSTPEHAFKFKGVFNFGRAVVLGRLIQAASFFVMAHLLSTGQMGVVAVLTVLFVGLYQLTNFGFDRYVIYTRQHATKALKGTINIVWTLQLLRGAAILAGAFPLWFAIGLLPDFNIVFGYVFGIVAAVALLSFVNPGLYLFERGGDFTKIGKTQATSLFVGGMVAMLTVSVWPSPWAYVLGQFANAATQVAFSFWLTASRPKIDFDPARMGEVLKFSKHLLVIATMSFLSVQFQILYIGGTFGAAALGAYFVWLRMVTLPREMLVQILGRIFFANASFQARQGASFSTSHLKIFSILISIILPFSIFVWFHGDILITLLASNKWLDYWQAGRIMVIISLLYAVSETIGPFLLNTRPHLSSLLRTIETVLTIALILILAPFYAIEGVLVGILIVMVLATLTRIVLLYKFVVLENRASHARLSFFVLVLASVPYLAAENLYLVQTNSWSWPGIPFTVFAAVFVTFTTITFKVVTKYLRGTK